jgi:streptogramin lyase
VLNRRQSQPDELVRVDPSTDKVVARIDAGSGASLVAVGEDGSVWLYRAGSALDRPQLVRVDPATNEVADVVELPAPAAGTPAGANALLAAGGSVWLAVQEGQLLQLDPASRQLREVTDDGASVETEHLAFAGGWVWAVRGLLLHRIDPKDGTVTATVSDPDRNGVLATGLAGGADGLWLLGAGAGDELYRLDPVTGMTRAMVQISSRAGGQVGMVAAGDQVVAVRGGKRLYLVDPAIGQIRAIVPVPEGRGGLAVGSGAVWVADPTGGRLLRVHPGF